MIRYPFDGLDKNLSILALFLACFFEFIPLSLAEDAVLPEVLVTINKNEEPENFSPYSVEVLTRQEIQAALPGSIAEVLSDISGVDITTSGTPGDTTNIRMRGSDRDEVLVLLDGVSILGNGEARADFLGMVPVDHVERIEVLKGSQGLLYGSEAVGGVINIITVKGHKHSGQSVKVTGGNLSFIAETATAHFVEEKTQTSLALTRQDKGGRGANDRFDATWFTGHLSHHLSDTLKIEGGLHVGIDNQELRKDQIIAAGAGPGGLQLNDYIVNDSNARNRHASVVNYLNLKNQWSQAFDSEIRYGQHFLRQRVLNSNLVDAPVDETGAALTPTSQHYRSNSFKSDLDFRHRLTLVDRPDLKIKLTSLAGYNFTFDHLQFINNSLPGDVGPGLPVTGGFPTPGAKSGRKNNAFYVDNQLAYKSWLLSAGFRFDHNSNYGNEFSPRAGLTYRIEKIGTRLFGSYSEGFHTPTIAEFWDVQIGGTATAIPIKGVAELTKSFEAGVEQELFKDKLHLKTQWFLTKYDQLLDIVEVVNGATSWGIEADVTAKPLQLLELGTNYTFNKATHNAGGADLTMRPRHHFNAQATVKPLKNLRLTADYHYVSSKLVPQIVSLTIGDLPVVFRDAAGNTATQLAGYSTLDFSARYQIPLKKKTVVEKWEVFGKAANILHQKYQQSFGYDMPGFEVTAGTRVVF